jgi:hypothetical protein
VRAGTSQVRDLGRLDLSGRVSGLQGGSSQEGVLTEFRADPAYTTSFFHDIHLLSDGGKPRLRTAQGFFYNEGSVDLDLLEAFYVYWRDFDEFLVLRSSELDRKTYSLLWKYVAVKCSKRGNDVYVSRVKQKMRWLSNVKNVKFFDASDFSISKQVHSKALWVTLTYDPSRCSMLEAWKQIGVEFNRFISAIRQKYGKISILRNWETYENGYPHVHAIILFHDAKFTVFPHLSSKEGRLQFRVKEKAEIASLWHSFVDVEALSSTKKMYHYSMKYQTKVLMNQDSPKGVRTMSILWLFGKRSFSVSGDFRSRLHDLIRTMHNSKMVFVQSMLDGSVCDGPVWEFVGVFSREFLKLKRYTRLKWVYVLEKDQVQSVLVEESRKKPVRLFDYD